MSRRATSFPFQIASKASVDPRMLVKAVRKVAFAFGLDRRPLVPGRLKDASKTRDHLTLMLSLSFMRLGA